MSIEGTVEPRYNKVLYMYINEVLSITNDIICPNSGKIYGKQPRFNEAVLL